MFRSSRLFKCIDYFEANDDDDSDPEPEAPQAKWAQPRSSGLQPRSSGASGLRAPSSRSQSAIPKVEPKRKVSQAPNLAYNAGARERQRKTDETSRLYRIKNGSKAKSIPKPNSARWN